MSKDRVLFNIIGYLFITLLAVACVLPFIMVISGSLTAEESIIQKGYSVFPREFSLNAYRLALKAPEKILRAYGVTTFVTVVGTFLGLLITSMTAYVLQRKDFSWRNKFAYFFFFTTLFSGGLVPWYVLMVKYLHLKNSIPEESEISKSRIERHWRKPVPFLKTGGIYASSMSFQSRTQITCLL